MVLVTKLLQIQERNLFHRKFSSHVWKKNKKLKARMDMFYFFQSKSSRRFRYNNNRCVFVYGHDPALIIFGCFPKNLIRNLLTTSLKHHAVTMEMHRYLKEME